MKGKVSNRRYSYRSVIPTLLIAGIFLPFVFIRTAFLALDASATICPSISCLGWRIKPLLFRGSDTSLEFAKELKRVYLDAQDSDHEVINPKFVESAPESFDHLLQEIASASTSYPHIDLHTFLLKTKAMLIKMDLEVKSSRHRASIYQHLASIGIPKSAHCVSLKLAEEYLVNSAARIPLPPPEHAYRLTNASYYHYAIMTDNILAASVVVYSTVENSANPEKLVFHIVTDKKTYNAMHAWFALNSISPAIVEVKGLHQFEWDPHVGATVLETVEEVRRSSLDHRQYKVGDDDDDDYRRLEFLRPSSFSILNYLRIHLPELFPKLKRVIHLDDDVIVQHDLEPLFNVDLRGKVVGAVIPSDNRDKKCIGKSFDRYFNFSNTFASLLPFELESEECAWLSGMNVFDLQAWRKTNITTTYQQMLKLNRESGFLMWSLGWLPPALIAFKNKLHQIDSSWHLSDLGLRVPHRELISTASVLHFSGHRKPWLEIGFPELRKIWFNYHNHSNNLLISCRVVR